MKTVSIYDRGFLYGDGVFETLLVLDGVPYLFNAHINRLLKSLKFFNIGTSFSMGSWKTRTKKFLKQYKRRTGTLRIVVTRGIDKKRRGVLYKSGKSSVIFQFYPRALTSKIEPGYTVLIDADNSPLPYPLCSHKTINRIYYLYLMTHKRHRVDEVLLIRDKKEILEGTHSNVFFVKKGIIITPPLRDLFLPGTTRKKIIQLAKKLRYNIVEKPVYINEVKKFDEIGICCSTRGIMPVKKVYLKNNKDIFPGSEIIKKLKQHFYDNMIIEINREKKDWIY